MSDELPAGSMDLEAEPTTAIAEAPAVIAETQAPPVVDPAHQPASVDSVEVAGKHYIPVAAIQDEREKRQAAEARATALEQQVQQNASILALLQQHQELLKKPEPAAVSPTDDPDALEAAKLMDFYTTDGKPDAARGAQYLALQDRRAQRVAQQAVAPMHQQTQHAKADANFQKALAMPGINPQTLGAVWQQVKNDPNGVNILADPQAAAFVAAAAMGLQTLTTKAPAPVALPPPIVTEGAGGGGGRRATVTELESRVAAERGLTTDKWAERTKGHIAGRSNLVED